MEKSSDNSTAFKGISTNILLLGLVSFLNDLSSEMIMPILPMFISALGGGGLVVGLVGGLRDSIASILKVVCGYWSDRTGNRKIFVYLGYGISTVFKFVLAFSRIWQQAVAFAAAERVGKGLRSAARDAIIADSATGARGRGFGVHRAFDTLGAIVGSALVFGLFWLFGLGFKSVILIAGGIGFFCLIPLYFVRETSTDQPQLEHPTGTRKIPRRLVMFIVVSSIFSLGNFSYMFFILRAQQFFTGKSEVLMPLGLYVLFNVFYAALAIPLGSLADTLGKARVIILGYLLYAATCLGFAYLDSTAGLVVFFGLYGVAHAAVDGTQRAFVSDLSAEGSRATALGAFHTTTGLLALVAGLAAGILWQGISPRAAFLYGASLSVTAVLVFVVLGGRLGQVAPETHRRSDKSY